MAIDSALKRRSAAAVGLGAGFVLLPAPDGTVAAVDRAQLLSCYAGLLTTPIAGAVAMTAPTLTFPYVDAPTLTFGGV